LAEGIAERVQSIEMLEWLTPAPETADKSSTLNRPGNRSNVEKYLCKKIYVQILDAYRTTIIKKTRFSVYNTVPISARTSPNHGGYSDGSEDKLTIGIQMDSSTSQQCEDSFHNFLTVA
jgi:hypothetical protein